MSHKTKVHGHVEQLSFLSNFNLEMYLDIAKDRSHPRRHHRRTEVSAMDFLLAALARRHPLPQRTGEGRGDDNARADDDGRHIRSPRRRLLSLFGGRALARPSLREDALRQCAPHRPDDGSLARDPKPTACPTRRGNDRLARSRDDRSEEAPRSAEISGSRRAFPRAA